MVNCGVSIDLRNCERIQRSEERQRDLQIRNPMDQTEYGLVDLNPEGVVQMSIE